MAGARVGPLYGDLPDLDPTWVLLASDGSVTFSSTDLRELIRDNLEIATSYTQLHRLSLAMNSTAELSSRAVKTIVQQVVEIETLRLKVSNLKQADPENPTQLPLVKADVVEYSEEPLKRGQNTLKLAIQPLEEEINRLAVKICISLDLCEFGVDGPCCSTAHSMASLIRS